MLSFLSDSEIKDLLFIKSIIAPTMIKDMKNRIKTWYIIFQIWFNEILKFNPDILFSVDSPDFTLRVAKLVKEKNPKIKVIHFIAPKVWAWRKGRIKKMKEFLDHILLLFKFEKEDFLKSSSLLSEPVTILPLSSVFGHEPLQ